MLALKQALSLVSTPKLNGWLPSDETSLEAWYRKGKLITLNGTDVADWEDSSGNGLTMSQGIEGKQPAYSAGVLTFLSTARDYLQTSGQIELSGEFTIGIRISPVSGATGTFLGDNTDSGERFKVTADDTLLIAIGGSSKNFTLDSGSFGDDYWVITRNGSDLISLWVNGVVQADTETLTGAALIDAISVRFENIDNFDGTISEIQIYSSSSAGLTANVNDRLSTL
mgnify:CR=1 FL=1